MYPPEDDEYVFCADCGGEVMISDRIYRFGEQRALCFDCATRRQGVYQELLERWSVSPGLDDLLDSLTAAVPTIRAAETLPKETCDGCILDGDEGIVVA